jgi:hypothetical protein
MSLLLADAVEKVTAEKLQNRNAQQSNLGDRSLESMLRIPSWILNQSSLERPAKSFFDSIGPTETCQ